MCYARTEKPTALDSPASHYLAIDPLRLAERSNTMKKVPTAVLLIAAAFAAEGFHVINKIKIGGTGGWDYATMDSANHRLYVSHGNPVEVVDLSAGKVVGTVKDTPGVHGIARMASVCPLRISVHSIGQL